MENRLRKGDLWKSQLQYKYSLGKQRKAWTSNLLPQSPLIKCDAHEPKIHNGDNMGL